MEEKTTNTGAWVIWTVAVAVLFVMLQLEHAYHFFFVEQNYMFLSSPPWMAEQMAVPGGFAHMAGEFMMQYYMYPYAGAAVTTVLLALTALLTAMILGRVNPACNWLFPAWLPALCLLFIHFDFNYNPAGTFAFILMLALCYVSLLISRAGWRLAYHIGAVCCLFWLCGPVFALYILLVLMYETGGKSPLRYASLVLVALGGALGWLSVEFALTGEYRFAFLPDQFYHNRLQPKGHIYYSWIALVALFALAVWLKLPRATAFLKKPAGIVLSFLLVLAFAVWGVRAFEDEKSKRVKKLDYLARTEQWAEIVEESGGRLTNYLYLCYLNMALAEQGKLGERMFQFDQRGVDGLLLKPNRTFSVSVMLSDIYFTIGNMAVAQEMAFEAYISSMGTGNPRMLKRLIQTNLVYGEYKVAEKYIDLLEQTAFYAGWARAQRTFLYDDKAVEADPLLGGKRRGLVDENYLATIHGTDTDLLAIANRNPSDRSAIEYLGGLLLLGKDVQGFSALLSVYYGTDVLPSLPPGFQEAVIILYENTPEEWLRYDVDKSVIDRFGHYKKAVLANKNSPSLPQIMAANYANTYWFYYMFK